MLRAALPTHPVTYLSRARAASRAWSQRAAWSWRGLSLTFALLLLTESARADATVVVEVKRSDGSSADGTVRLSKGETKVQCVTNKGRCEIKDVPGGLYSVEFEQAGKPAGKPKTVMIPPSGEVKLIVASS